MFGNNERLERQLREEGAAHGVATVLKRSSHVAVTMGSSHTTIHDSDKTWKLRVRVQTEGQPPFETTFKQRFQHIRTPDVGETFPVIYDPHDHSRIVLDTKPGVPDAVAATGLDMGDIGAILDSAGLPQNASWSIASRGGVPMPFATPPATTPPVDPIALLEQLADMRGRGLLTDEEFAAQKARLLS